MGESKNSNRVDANLAVPSAAQPSVANSSPTGRILDSNVVSCPITPCDKDGIYVDL
jgi:hypothetical protein